MPIPEATFAKDFCKILQITLCYHRTSVHFTGRTSKHTTYTKWTNSSHKQVMDTATQNLGTTEWEIHWPFSKASVLLKNFCLGYKSGTILNQIIDNVIASWLNNHSTDQPSNHRPKLGVRFIRFCMSLTWFRKLLENGPKYRNIKIKINYLIVVVFLCILGVSSNFWVLSFERFLSFDCFKSYKSHHKLGPPVIKQTVGWSVGYSMSW